MILHETTHIDTTSKVRGIILINPGHNFRFNFFYPSPEKIKFSEKKSIPKQKKMIGWKNQENIYQDIGEAPFIQSKEISN
jgi:hypothetical protein